MSTKPDTPTPEPPAPRRRWPLGATLAVPCALTVGILFFLPWYHVIGSTSFGEPKLLFPVSGLDRARGFDMNARIDRTHIGYRQLGSGEQTPISPRAIGPVFLNTHVHEPAPLLWLVPSAALCLMGLAIARLSSCGRRVVSALMVVAALALVTAGALEAVASHLNFYIGPLAAKGAFVVRAESQLSLYMALGVSVLAVACSLFDVVGRTSNKDFS